MLDYFRLSAEEAHAQWRFDHPEPGGMRRALKRLLASCILAPVWGLVTFALGCCYFCAWLDLVPDEDTAVWDDRFPSKRAP